MGAGAPDFTERERWVVRTTVGERWGPDKVELHPADIGVRPEPGAAREESRPALFWRVGGCNFVVVKLGEDRYRCGFFYGDLQQFAPDAPEYTELAECVVQLLQIQADHARAAAPARP